MSHLHLAEAKTRDSVDHLVRMVAEMLGNGVSGLWWRKLKTGLSLWLFPDTENFDF